MLFIIIEDSEQAPKLRMASSGARWIFFFGLVVWGGRLGIPRLSTSMC